MPCALCISAWPEVLAGGLVRHMCTRQSAACVCVDLTRICSLLMHAHLLQRPQQHKAWQPWLGRSTVARLAASWCAAGFAAAGAWWERGSGGNSWQEGPANQQRLLPAGGEKPSLVSCTHAQPLVDARFALPAHTASGGNAWCRPPTCCITWPASADPPAKCHAGNALSVCLMQGKRRPDVVES